MAGIIVLTILMLAIELMFYTCFLCKRAKGLGDDLSASEKTPSVPTLHTAPEETVHKTQTQVRQDKELEFLA
jgi:hypothetical protein